MNTHERHPVERHDGVTIYGRILDNSGKLGRYEVFSDVSGSNGMVYHEYSDAEIRMKQLIGFSKHQNNQPMKKENSRTR